MKKTSIKNMGVSVNPRVAKTDQLVVRKLNNLPPILSVIADRQTTKNRLHVVKWLDMYGFINVAFQILGPKHSRENQLESTSVVFAQTSSGTILISAIQISTDGVTSPKEQRILGTCGVEELTESFIMEKIKQFLEYADGV